MKDETTTENTKNTETNTEVPEQLMLPGMEDLAAENEALRGEIRMRDAIYDIETKLAQAGAKSPGLLTDRAKERFQFSEEGDLTNAEAVVEHFRKTYPEQFAPASIDASAGRTPRPTLTKEALARMTPAEIQRLDWAEVKATLSA
jgi:hypothetical protein